LDEEAEFLIDDADGSDDNGAYLSFSKETRQLMAKIGLVGKAAAKEEEGEELREEIKVSSCRTLKAQRLTVVDLLHVENTFAANTIH
jgi:hypothetical protein